MPKLSTILAVALIAFLLWAGEHQQEAGEMLGRVWETLRRIVQFG